ncbi:MAG: hypothetical protein K1X89_11795 [Myxococcaceae bacterium]|nr:hypothetical protein [Myxococcaceae bacterium]
MRRSHFSLLCCAWAALGSSCAVDVEQRIRSCTSASPCGDGKVCVDGWCVAPDVPADALGACEASAVLDAENLIGNPDLERDATGWAGLQASVERIAASGLPARNALRVSAPAGTKTEFGLNDSPSWVPHAPKAGARYCFAAWVRAESSTSKVEIDLKEYDSGDVLLGAITSPGGTLSPSWKRLRVEYVNLAADSFIDLHARVLTPQSASETFEVTHLSLKVAPP